MEFIVPVFQHWWVGCVFVEWTILAVVAAVFAVFIPDTFGFILVAILAVFIPDGLRVVFAGIELSKVYVSIFTAVYIQSSIRIYALAEYCR